jgi:sigma-B regulation protein RsbU (phosphoserine phosphatase)
VAIADPARPRGALLPPPSTILVVDDSPMNLQVLVRTLDGTGHRILAARSGQAALDIARRARPDLVLLDVMMPGMDGFEVCRAIKADPRLEDIAVIFLSALGEVSDKVSGLQLGAVDYITKPIQAEEVLARVANHLTRRYLEREVRRSRDGLERELANAAGMQRLILPSALPADPALDFAAYYRTSRYAGGDYYDVLSLGGRRFGLIVADVSGHGASAAIVMAMIRAVLHASRDARDDPAGLLRALNQHFCYLWETATFATALYGVIDAGRRTLQIACAGHPPPLLLRGEATAAPLAIEAVPALFWAELTAIPVVRHDLQPGDRLVFYSDGITERHGPNDTFFEIERLIASLSAPGTRSPQAIVDRLVADLDTFAAGLEPEDDQTILVGAIAQ